MDRGLTAPSICRTVAFDDPFGIRVELVSQQETITPPADFSRAAGIAEIGHLCQDAPDVHDAYLFWRRASAPDAFVTMAHRQLPLGRWLIRLTVDTPPVIPPPEIPQRRGFQRIGWIELVVEPLQFPSSGNFHNSSVTASARRCQVFSVPSRFLGRPAVTFRAVRRARAGEISAAMRCVLKGEWWRCRRSPA